jgi:ABC-type branched-subunit amino acid transport system substrate-binding protein
MQSRWIQRFAALDGGIRPDVRHRRRRTGRLAHGIRIGTTAALTGPIAARQLNFKFAAEIKADAKNPDWDGTVAAVRQSLPQAVLLGTAGAYATRFIQAMQRATMHPTYYGLSIFSPGVIRRELVPAARGIVLAQALPSLRTPAIPVVAEYTKLLTERSPEAKPNRTEFDGYISAKLLVEALRRAGRP